MIIIKFLSEAEEEFNAASKYYEAQDPGLGLDFIAEIEHSIHNIKKSPKR